MFDVYCPDHGSRVLLFSRDIEAIYNTREGIEVHYLCPCGYQGGLANRTGSKQSERKPGDAEAAFREGFLIL